MAKSGFLANIMQNLMDITFGEVSELSKGPRRILDGTFGCSYHLGENTGIVKLEYLAGISFTVLSYQKSLTLCKLLQ